MMKENKKAYIRPAQTVIVLQTRQVFLTGSIVEDPEDDPGSFHNNAPGMIGVDFEDEEEY